MKPVAFSRNAKPNRTGRNALLTVGLVFLLLWTLAPIYWLLVSAISPTNELAAYPPHWFPRNPTFERFGAILGGGTLASSSMQTMSDPGLFFRRATFNSLVVALTTTLLCLTLGSFTGYAFARLRFRGRRILMMLPLALQMLPPIALVIPLFSVIRALHLTDTQIGLILIYPSFMLVYVIWLMTGFYQNVPPALEDAARIDGCTRIGTIVRIVIPLSLPALFSTGLLTFLLAWDEFLYALVLTSSRAQTLPVAIGQFSTQFGIDYGMMMTGGLLATVPPMVIALLFHPLLAKGLTAGAVKG